MKEHPNYKYRPRRKPKSLVSKMESSPGYGPPSSPHHPGLSGLTGLSGLSGLPRLMAPTPCPPPPRHGDLPPHHGFSPGALLSRALFPPLPYPLYPHLQQHLQHAAAKLHADDLQASGKIADLAWQVSTGNNRTATSTTERIISI